MDEPPVHPNEKSICIFMLFKNKDIFENRWFYVNINNGDNDDDNEDDEDDK